MATMTPEALRQAGLDALRRELGAAGMVRFLQQFEMGRGDYTAERWRWLSAETDVNSLAMEIQQAASLPAHPEAAPPPDPAFQRRTSLIRFDENSLRQSVSTIQAFSALEGLDAHGRSATIRFD